MSNTKRPNVPLVRAVRVELHKRKGTWPAIARKAKVSYRWLIEFAARQENPQLRPLERLAAVLGLKLSTHVSRAEPKIPKPGQGARDAGGRI